MHTHLFFSFPNMFSIWDWLQLLFRIWAIAASSWPSLHLCDFWAAPPRWRTPTFADCMCTVDATRHRISQRWTWYEHYMNIIWTCVFHVPRICLLWLAKILIHPDSFAVCLMHFVQNVEPGLIMIYQHYEPRTAPIGMHIQVPTSLNWDHLPEGHLLKYVKIT